MCLLFWCAVLCFVVCCVSFLPCIPHLPVNVQSSIIIPSSTSSSPPPFPSTHPSNMSLSTTPQSHSQPDHLDTSPLFSSQHTLSEPSYQSLPSSDSTQHAGSSLYSLPHDSDSIHPPPLPSSNGFHHTYSSPEDFRLTPPKEVTSPLSSPSFHPSPTTPPPSQPHAIQPRSPTTASSAFSFTSTDSQPGSLREESQFPSSFPPLSSSPLPSSLHGDGHPHDSPSNGFKPSSSPFHRSPAPLRAASRESMYSHSNGDVHHNMYTADNPLHQLASVTPLILAPSFLPYQSSSSSCHSLLSYSHPHQRQDSDSIFHSHTHSNGHPQHTALKSNGDDPMNVHIEEEEEEVEFSHCVPAHRTPRQQRHITVKSETEQYRHTDEFCYEPVPALLPASPLPRHHCDPFVNGNGILHFPSSSPFAPPTLPVRHAERRELNGHGEERKRGGKRGRVIKSEPNVIRTSTARMLNGIPVHLASIVDPPSSNGHSSRPKKPAIASNGEAVNEVFASPTELSVSPLIFDNRPTHNSNKPKRFFCQECGKGPCLYTSLLPLSQHLL